MARGVEARGGLLWEAIGSTATVVIFAAAVDCVYQWLVLDTFYPREAVAIALLLGFIPYFLLRGFPARHAPLGWEESSCPVVVRDSECWTVLSEAELLY